MCYDMSYSVYISIDRGGLVQYCGLVSFVRFMPRCHSRSLLALRDVRFWIVFEVLIPFFKACFFGLVLAISSLEAALSPWRLILLASSLASYPQTYIMMTGLFQVIACFPRSFLSFLCLSYVRSFPLYVLYLCWTTFSLAVLCLCGFSMIHLWSYSRHCRQLLLLEEPFGVLISSSLLSSVWKRTFV